MESSRLDEENIIKVLWNLFREQKLEKKNYIQIKDKRNILGLEKELKQLKI